jgi:hypothetical protein
MLFYKRIHGHMNTINAHLSHNLVSCKSVLLLIHHSGMMSSIYTGQYSNINRLCSIMKPLNNKGKLVYQHSQSSDFLRGVERRKIYTEFRYNDVSLQWLPVLAGSGHWCISMPMGLRPESSCPDIQ